MIKVNGKDITLTQIAAILSIVGSLIFAGAITYKHFAKQSDMTKLELAVENAEHVKAEIIIRQNQDWQIQRELKKIAIDTGNLLLIEEKKSPIPADATAATHRLERIAARAKDIKQLQLEDAIICEQQKERKLIPSHSICGFGIE